MMSHCAVHSCKTSTYNKPPGVILHPCPQSAEMRSKWLVLLRNKCPMLDWATSKICSKHFENKYFDSSRKLKDNAVPTLFPSSGQSSFKIILRLFQSVTTQPGKDLKRQDKVINAKSSAKIVLFNRDKNTEQSSQKMKIDKVLSRMTQSQLMSDINKTAVKMREPLNLTEFVTSDLRCKPDAPLEAQLWLLVKKQENLNARLLEGLMKSREKVAALQKQVDDTKNAKKEGDKNIDTYKYIVKCLQEKQASLEEQVEILSAVESR